MATIIMSEMNLSHTDFSLVFSMAMISLVLFRIPWGLIGDKIGYVNAFRIALSISAISTIVRAIAPDYLLLLVAQFFLGLGLAAVLPCLSILIRDWTPNNPGTGTGIYVSGFALGNITALGLTPYLLEIMRWREVLLVYGGLVLLICLLWLALVRSEATSLLEFRLEKVSQILKEPYVWMLLVLLAVSMGSYDTLATWMPKVLEYKGNAEAFAALLPVGFFLAGPTIGFVIDRIQNKRLIITLLGLLATLSILGINYASSELTLLCIFLAGYSTIGAVTVCLAMPAKDAKLAPILGSVIGLISSIGNLGPLVMPTYSTSIFCMAFFASMIIVFGGRIANGQR
jgi:cyanate permease